MGSSDTLSWNYLTRSRWFCLPTIVGIISWITHVCCWQTIRISLFSSPLHIDHWGQCYMSAPMKTPFPCTFVHNLVALDKCACMPALHVSHISVVMLIGIFRFGIVRTDDFLYIYRDMTLTQRAGSHVNWSARQVLSVLRVILKTNASSKKLRSKENVSPHPHREIVLMHT